MKNCSKCETELQDAPGIGPYCPNKDCDVIDNINAWDKPETIQPHLLGKERHHFDWDKHKQDLVIKECIKEVSQYHSTTIYDGFIPENPTREHYEEWAYIKGINQGYNDAVKQIVDGLKQYFEVE